MNIYVINNVLTDYTPGMAVIAASDLDRCRELFNDRFNYGLDEFDDDIAFDDYKVIEGVNHDEGIISYVYGGG